MIRRLRALLALRIVRAEDDWPFPALELVRPDGRGWLLLPLTTDLTTRPLLDRDPAPTDIPAA